MIGPGMLEPGIYLGEGEWRGGGAPAVYVHVHGVASCGGPHLDVTFDCTGRKVRRTVRVAINGSWRCVRTYLPVNSWGDTFE